MLTLKSVLTVLTATIWLLSQIPRQEYAYHVTLQVIVDSVIIVRLQNVSCVSLEAISMQIIPVFPAQAIVILVIILILLPALLALLAWCWSTQPV